MLLNELSNMLKSGKVAPVYVISGEEDPLRSDAAAMIEEAVLEGDDKGINKVVFVGNDVEMRALLDELRTSSLFGGRRLVIVKDADALLSSNDADLLTAYSKAPSGSNCLVLFVTKLDKRKAVTKQVLKTSVLVECKKIYDDKLPKWLNQMARTFKKTLSSEAADTLLHNTGNNLLRLKNELEKLSIYVGKAKNIEKDDVEAVCARDREMGVFELTNALAARNASEGLRILNRLLLSGEQPIRLLSLLVWQFRRIWQGHRLMDTGAPRSEIAGAARVHPRFLDQFISQIKLFSEQDLVSKYRLLLETDMRLKSGTLSPRMVMEQAVVRLCKATDRSNVFVYSHA